MISPAFGVIEQQLAQCPIKTSYEHEICLMDPRPQVFSDQDTSKNGANQLQQFLVSLDEPQQGLAVSSYESQDQTLAGEVFQ